MKEEYIIINKTAIQKRIEELGKTQNIYAPSGHFPNPVMYERNVVEKHTLQYLLSQSTPLIPEIEKLIVMSSTSDIDFLPDRVEKIKQDYIINLKLNI